MAAPAVQPLRISKMTPTSPSKLPRPLSEVGTTERRRNSPSYNQSTKTIITGQESPSRDSAPFRAGRPMFTAKDSKLAQRFGQENSPEREPALVPSKKSSIENLKKQSRVANSPMFAKETRDQYDPSSSPLVERPLTDRPLSDRIQQNPFKQNDSVRKENSPFGSPFGSPFKSPERVVHRRTENRADMIDAAHITSPTSPQKSSLTAKSRYGRPAAGSDNSSSGEDTVQSTPRHSLRAAKSVTFQSAPPERHEYEQQTPEASSLPSDSREGSCESDEVEDNSFERDSSTEQDSFDASLEDTSKTPVVLPGDWAHASPDTARTQLVDEDDNVFDAGSPSPSASPSKLQRSESSNLSCSVLSESSTRPLPPIPDIMSPRGRKTSASLTAAAERASSASSSRGGPSPIRAAAATKDEIRMRDTSMSQLDRMSLLALQEVGNQVLSASARLQQSTADGLGDLPDFNRVPLISRESILKKVKADLNNDAEVDKASLYDDDEEVDYSELARVDPDTPIPSRENSTQFRNLNLGITEEEGESALDLAKVPSLSYEPEDNRQSSVIHHQAGAGLGISNDTLAAPTKNLKPKSSAPFLANFLSNNDEYDFGLTDFMAKDHAGRSRGANRLSMGPLAAELRASMSPSEDSFHDICANNIGHRGPSSMEPPVIPERKATIKTGGKLKARPSGTQADLEAILQAQRAAFAEEPMPDLPFEYRTISGQSDGSASIWSQPSSTGSAASKNDSAQGSAKEIKIDLPIASSDSDLGGSLSLSQEMSRLMDSHQKGYLTRENAKVVVASQRNFSQESGASADSAASAATSSTVKHENRKVSEKFIQTEPWNGKVRRKSNSVSSAVRPGVAPPLPGQESALDTLEENSILSDADTEAERGRLFVKVVGVRNLDMPLPKSDSLFFQLTLDNGLHCVTTGNLGLEKSCPIGQEFELVVQQDLDFQLTLTTNLPPPPRPTSSPSKPRSPTKNVFSRLLSSPKKRAEQERRAQAEFEAEERRRFEEAERQRLTARPTVWDRMRELVDGTTGSFGRSYVSLKTYETDCYGRQLTCNVPLYNEWASEKDMQVISSVRSKRSNGFGAGGRSDLVRRPPYEIGHLEVQMLYVPRGKKLKDDDMPKSMSAAIREMKEAEKSRGVRHEGFLSQQGGDCPYWRRRFFRLSGTKLTAYHEHTMQPRATINLAKASRLIDDKTSLIADPAHDEPSKPPSGSKKRRKSAFAEEDEGYQFVEEGFRLRFANGETIDFYADGAAAKNEFMAALTLAMGRTAASASAPSAKVAAWTDAVLDAEHHLRSAAAKATATTATATTTAHHAPAINVCPPTSSQASLASRSTLSSSNSAASSPAWAAEGWTRSAPSSPAKKHANLRKEAARPALMTAVGGASPPSSPARGFDDMEWLAGAAAVAPESPPASPKKKEGRARKAVRSMIF